METIGSYLEATAGPRPNAIDQKNTEAPNTTKVLPGPQTHVEESTFIAFRPIILPTFGGLGKHEQGGLNNLKQPSARRVRQNSPNRSNICLRCKMPQY